MSEVADVDLHPVRVAELFAGAGGLGLGFRVAVPSARTVLYCENEITAIAVLVARIKEGRLDDAPIWTDVKTLDGLPWRGAVDCLLASYPCQPFSNAGRRLGQDDPRHLWPEVARITAEVEPRLVFFENVGAHLRLGFREVASDLHAMGYRVAATLLTASEVGAPHGRERLFILGVADTQRAERWTLQQAGVYEPDRDDGGRQEAASGLAVRGAAVADSKGELQREPHDAGRALARQDASGFSGDVADANLGSRGPEPREQHPQRAEVAVGAGAVGDSQGIGRGEGRPEHGMERGRDATARTERSMGHADITRLEGRGEPECGGGYELPAWPPGPQATDAWRRVLAVRPDLAPAIEPAVRGVADGMAGGLGRSDQLHILGNGVVPAQAAYAFALLAEELGL